MFDYFADLPPFFMCANIFVIFFLLFKHVNKAQLRRGSTFKRFLHSSACWTSSFRCLSLDSVPETLSACPESSQSAENSGDVVSDYGQGQSNTKTDNLYYFENGFRKVYPYKFTYLANAKASWIGKSLHWVLKEFFGVSKEQTVIKCKVGKIRVQGMPVNEDYPFKLGDVLHHDIHFHENPVLNRPIKIIYKDNEKIVIDKPCSVPVHRSGRYAQNTVLEILRREHGISEIINVNRLDRLTSGVLVMAPNAESARNIQELFAGDYVKKRYVARVVGEFPEGDTLISEKIKQISPSDGYSEVRDDGKISVTKFRRMFYDKKSNESVVLCTLLTGRTHQIRVHLVHLKHPIVNDILYHPNSLHFCNPTARRFEPKVLIPPDRGVRWEFDDSCLKCTLPQADPRPETLEMYLHALCYSGPNWKFETDLPLWANPNWEYCSNVV